MKERLYKLKRSIEKKINSTIFKYSNNRYAIAFRQRGANALYEVDPSLDSFILVKNSLKYWRADPFIFKYKGTNYLFAELYNKQKAKGVIAYAKLKDNHCGKFHVCLEEEYHLSYPCVFRRGNSIYMIPETKANGKSTIYRAVKFPEKWEKYKDICNLPCVDTTPFELRGEYYYFTTIANSKSTDDNLHLISEKDGSVKCLLSDNLCARSAGKVIVSDKQIIRPSQDDTVYGDAVVFNEITTFEKSVYSERAYRRLLPPGKTDNPSSICVNVEGFGKDVFTGLHTYNVNENYEVIDLRYPRRKKRR